MSLLKKFKENVRVFIGLIITMIAVIVQHSFKSDDFYEGFVFIPIYLIAFIISSYDILRKMVTSLFHKQFFSEYMLMGIASIAAFCIGEYLESLIVIIFYEVGEILQDLAVDKAVSKINALVENKVDVCKILIDGQLVETDIQKVKIGDILCIAPGELIPVDGMVVEGNSLIDTSSFNGEGFPIEVFNGAEVISGCVNIKSVIYIRANKDLANSKVTEINDLINMATARKSQSEKFVTRFARYYTPIVVILAAIIAILGPILSKDMQFIEWGKKALVFLVASCPCALVLSVPLVFFAGIGNAVSNGIVMKGSNLIDKVARLKSILFDKTGTLTEWKLDVTHVEALGDISKEQIVEYMAYAEYHSNHPIANTIKEYYAKEIQTERIEQMHEVGGFGVEAIIDGKKIKVGKRAFILDDNTKEEVTSIYLSIDDNVQGYVVLENRLKSDARSLIDSLHTLGINDIKILTGDNKYNALKVANEVGIKEVKYGLRPEEKYAVIEKVKSSNKVVAYVGDGINDAPSLALADVGIAMGKYGSDAAIKSGDVVILRNDVRSIYDLIKISRKAKRIAIENIVFALGVKFIVLILALTVLPSMYLAVFADVGVALLAVLNAMRASRYNKGLSRRK